MIKEKNIWEAIEEALRENNVDMSYFEYYKAWPVIAGPKLSSSLKLTSTKNLDKKTIHVTPSSISVRSLLKLEEKNIIKRWNDMFPDKQIEKIIVLPCKP